MQKKLDLLVLVIVLRKIKLGRNDRTVDLLKSGNQK